MSDGHFSQDDDLIPRLIDGAGLRVVLEPDPVVSGYSEPVLESFDLAHVLINGDKVWGITRVEDSAAGIGMMQDFGWDLEHPAAYAYNNFCPAACYFAPGSGMARFFANIQYAALRFVARDDGWRRVWSLGDGLPFDELEARVADGHRFRVAIEDSQGLVNLHPVHLLELYKESRDLLIATSNAAYPVALRNPMAMDQVVRTLQPHIDAGDAQSMFVQSPYFAARYVVRGDGTLTRPDQRPSPPPQATCKRLDLFVDGRS